ncbi:LysE family translocator [Comamonas sp. GB3 AK4-5]|uniref:LysE family translocator n=1 Tax=Comamonas sp. GB3 AK4-5 TaxID=3231487 RepID=UPI00351E5B4F
MPISDWSFFAVIATILLTPGPTNTLLAAAGIRSGLRSSWQLIPAECLGYLIATTIWGALLQVVVTESPWLVQLIQLASGLYIGKLGWELWVYASLQPGNSQVPAIGRRQLLVATLLNPKAVIFALALFPAQTWMSASNYACVMGGFSLLVVGIGTLWIAFGAVLLGGRIAWLQPRHFQRVAAVVLWGFAAWLLLKAVGA